MKITELNIVEFGCLKDTVISIEDGMNIIEGDNESGKSTVMLFIRFMLYGLPKRSSKSYDRERCLSFDGHRAAGSMTLTHSGKNYRIERTAVGTSRISETLGVTCLDTGEKIEKEPHELFLGVPSEVFESSCSVSQMRAADISHAQAASSIENLMVSADESIDVKKVLDKLDKVRREYKLNKGEGGLIHRTETEISELNVRKRAATERFVRFNEQRARLERKERDLASTQKELLESESELERIRAAQTLERFGRLEASRKALLETKQELAALEKNFGEAQALPDESHVFSLRSAISRLEDSAKRLDQTEREYASAALMRADESLAEIGRKAEADGGLEAIMRRANGADKKARKAKLTGVIFVCLGALLAVLAALMISLPVTVACGALAVVFAGVAVVSFVSSASAKKQRQTICDSYGKSLGELETHLSACIGELLKKRQEDAQLIAARSKRDSALEELERARQKLAALTARTSAGVPATVSELIRTANSEVKRCELFCGRKEEIDKQIYALRALCESDAAALENYDEEALRSFVGESGTSIDPTNVAAVEKRVKFNKAKLAALTLEVSNLRESQAALGAGLHDDPVALGDKIAALEKKIERDTEYFEALMLAKKAIEQASVSMSGNFTPEISRRAGEMLALISGGRHASAQTNKSLDLSVEQDGFSVAADMLSGGTRDAAYVCLRIALMIKLFGAELPPLLLDEAMCQLDDGRARVLLTLLARLYDELGLQTIVFTCHTRESAMSKQMGIKTNCVNM